MYTEKQWESLQTISAYKQPTKDPVSDYLAFTVFIAGCLVLWFVTGV